MGAIFLSASQVFPRMGLAVLIFLAQIIDAGKGYFCMNHRQLSPAGIFRVLRKGN